MTYKYKTGIYIGRFQPVHLGHLKTIEVMLKMCENIIISIGSANRPKTIENPWHESHREEMIKTAVLELFEPEEYAQLGFRDIKPKTILDRIKFQYINDYMYNDNKWAAETYTNALLNGATSDKDTCLFGHFKDDSSYYLNMYPQWSLYTVINYKNINATDVREDFFNTNKLTEESKQKMMSSTIKEVETFITVENNLPDNLFNEFSYLVGYKSAWKLAPFVPSFTTVDALVIKSGHVLLIQRGRNPGKGLYALPGGFLNPDEYIKDGIIRELKEETKIKVSKEELENLRDKNPIATFDHPKRSKRGRTITHVGLMDLGVGALPEVKAADDAASAQWVPLSMIHKISHKMFEDHFDIIVSLTSKF
jgi:bifunctional NMN adenylyltransferase/nudix hydrolase